MLRVGDTMGDGFQNQQAWAWGTALPVLAEGPRNGGDCCHPGGDTVSVAAPGTLGSTDVGAANGLMRTYPRQPWLLKS